MVVTERRGRVATVRLDRPPLHLIGREVIARLREAFETLRAQDPPSVAVLHCTGGGADVRELASLDLDTAEEFITSLHRACAAVRALDAPVIAAVDGPCLGAHLEIAAACDLRICSETSRLGMPEMKVGIPSVIDAVWLAAHCGLGEAARLVYDGDVIYAREAHRIGLVQRVAQDLEAESAAWADRLAEMSPVALRQQKRVLRDWTEGWYERSVERSIEHFRATFEHGEANEAMRAFLEKRPARF